MAHGRVILAIAGATLLGALFGAAALPAPPAAAAPAGYPISGIDVSAFQGSINWTAVAAGGAQFAYIRASEQAGIPDAFFAANLQAAKANGIYAGAYHRARPDVSSGEAQADYLIDHAGYADDGRTLPPMLDIEWPRSDWTGLNACYNLTPAQISAWIRAFVDRVAMRTGRLATIYTNPNWWNPCTANNATFGANPLFNSGYLPTPPPPPAGWTRWTLWQYANAGSLPGDQDVFNGDYAALARLAGGVPFGLLASANGRYVTAEHSGSSALIANRTAMNTWERFDLIDAGGGYVALRSHANGRLVTAEQAGSSPLIANRSLIGEWEKFTMVVNADGTVSFQAKANGRYVTAEHAGSSPLIANRTVIGVWERFSQVPLPGLISLRAEVNGKYVTAENAGALPLIANRDAVWGWETFDQIDAGGGYIALRARANGKYVSADNGGASPLIANRTAIGTWEKFRANVRPDARISLLALADGRFVTADQQGVAPLIADANAVGPAQLFRPMTL